MRDTYIVRNILVEEHVTVARGVESRELVIDKLDACVDASNR